MGEWLFFSPNSFSLNLLILELWKVIEKVVFLLSLDALSTYNRCEAPPALLVLDTWVTAVLALTRDSRTVLS